MDKRTIFAVGLFMLLFGAVFAATSIFHVKAQNFPVHNLNTSVNYATIQGAINDVATSNGDTILVDAGTYSEKVVVNKTVTLVGQNPQTTVIDGGGTADYIFQVLATDVNIENFTLKNTNSDPLSSSPAIRVFNVENVTVKDVIITNVVIGVEIRSANFTTIAGCRIYESKAYGIYIHEVSRNNTIVANTLEMNANATALSFASSGSVFSRVFHNNFVNNTNDVVLQAINYFDDGYPSGGNYWSKYTGVDLDRDGIGDTPYAVVGDKYPLVGNFSAFSISSGVKTYQVDMSSNSSVSSFEFSRPSRTIHFNVSGSGGVGSCRLSIPYGLVFPPYNVTLDGGQTGLLYLDADLYDNGTFRWMYFAYNHTQHAVTIQSAASLFLQSPTELSPAYMHPGTNLTVATVYTENSPLNLTIEVFNATSIIGNLTINSGLENGTDVARSDVVTLGDWVAEGFYDVNVTLSNTADLSREATEANSVVVDVTPPTIGTVSQNPAMNDVHADDTVAVNVEIIDSLSGLKQVTLSYSPDGAPWTNVTMTNLLGNIYNATIQSFTYNANVTYVVTAEDNANNTLTTQDLGYTLQYRVIPEFTTALILPLFIAATLLAVLAYKKMRFRPKSTSTYV